MTSYTGTINRLDLNNMQNGSVTVGRTLSEAERRKRIIRDRRFVARITIMAIAGLFILIGLRAYGATIQHENNELIRDNQYLQAEIDSLKSQIIEETKVTRIEKVATSEYGMVYPTSDNCVRIKSDKEDRENLAALIRSEAYN
jgi:cell division protein FtsL